MSGGFCQADTFTNSDGTGPASATFGWLTPNSVLSASSNYTVTTTDGVSVVSMTTGASNVTVTLPAVASSGGRILTIKKIDSGAGTITITPNGGTINGNTTNVLTAQYSWITMYCNGANWFVTSVFDYLQGSANEIAAGTSGQNNDAVTLSVPPGLWDATGSARVSSGTMTGQIWLVGIGTVSGNTGPNLPTGLPAKSQTQGFITGLPQSSISDISFGAMPVLIAQAATGNIFLKYQIASYTGSPVVSARIYCKRIG